MGERNHRWFVGFIFALTVLTVYVFVVSLYSLIDAGVTSALSDSLGSHVVAIVEVVFTFVTGWCFLSLSCYHLYLISESTTTNAHIKAQRAERSRQAHVAFERHQRYAMRIAGGQPITASDGAQSAEGGLGLGGAATQSAEEAAVGVISGSAFTKGTTDDGERKEEGEEEAQRQGLHTAPTAQRPGEVAVPVGQVPGTVVGQVNTYGAGKRFVYPDVDAALQSSGPLHACWLFFCSPLPPSLLHMDGDVAVDDKGRITAYLQQQPRA